jgi:hypothetical protein
VQLWLRDGQPIGAYARHYYDLFRLGEQPEVLAMLSSPEYAAIKADYDRVSSAHFPANHFPPEKLSFSGSPALFPSDELEGGYQRRTLG